MKKNLKWPIIIIAAVVIAFTSYKWLYPTYIWHQKFTLEVEVDGDVFTGSSVVVVRKADSGFLMKRLGSPIVSSFSGEAAYVELPGNRYLFALLSGGTGQNFGGKDYEGMWHRVLGDLLPQKRQLARFRHLSKLRVKREIPPVHYPLLVTFTDITDPSTVKRVDPDDLESHFGAGVKLKRVTLEITGEKVTRGEVEKVLGWWKEYREKHYRLNGERCIACPVRSDNIADLIGPGVFKVGD